MRFLICAAFFMALPFAADAQAPSPLATCQIIVDPVDFGDYSTVSRKAVVSSGRIELRCLSRAITGGVRVTLSTGHSGHYQDRTLLHGANSLRYNLYVDAGRHRVAGDGTQGTSPLVPVGADAKLKDFRGGQLAASRAEFRVYARIEPGQSVPAGEYVDDILVIVEF